VFPALVMTAALVGGGCSADFLRFDSPVFSLNGDAPTEASASANDTSLYANRSLASAADAGGAAPVAAVERPTDVNYNQPARMAAAEAPLRPAAEPSRRYASNEAPDVKTPETRPAGVAEKARPGDASQVTTGALGGGGTVTVEPGDTLYQLSRRHGVSVAALRQANGLTNNVIRPGQQLIVPDGNAGARSYSTSNNRPAVRYRNSEGARGTGSRSASSAADRGDTGQTYTVQPGDSLYAISRRTGVSVAELKRANSITDVRTIQPGRRLRLGGAAAPRSRVAARGQSRRASEIRRKSIRTVPMGGVKSPKILNKRPTTPIATKPKTRVASATPAAGAEKFLWPARGRIIAPFNHSDQGVKNDGIKIALDAGTNIGAADAGVVAYAGSELKGYGNLVLIRHDNGWVSAYAHASEVLVKRGDRVARGQIIAKAGRSGGVTQSQLHFELRKGAKPVDPLPHLAAL